MGAQRREREAEVKFLLRLPESLHAKVKKKAERDDRSMHQTLIHAARLLVEGVTGD